MAEYEKGVKVEKITTTDYDANPTKETKNKIDTFMMDMRSRPEDRIPMRLHGRGPAAYLLHDWVHHRGKGAARVT